MTTPSATLTPRPNTHMRLDHDVAAELRVARQEHRLAARSTSRPSRIARSRKARLHRRLGGGELHAVVDAHHLLLGGHAGDRRQPAPAGDLDASR